MNSLDIDDIILGAICCAPFVLAGLWCAVALLRNGGFEDSEGNADDRESY